MVPIALQLARLRRHYDHCVRTYDDVSLLDLSNALRLFTEMGDELMKDPRFSSNAAFKAGCPSRRAMRVVRGSPYLLSHLGSPTVSYAHEGHIASSSAAGASFTAATKLRLTSDGGLEVLAFQYVASYLPPEVARSWQKFRIKRCNYRSWLGAEVVRYRYEGPGGHGVQDKMARSTLVKRVANSQGASHPGLTPSEGGNRYDEHLGFLMEFRVGALPLPYFVLLNTARAILDKLETSQE